jgi:hypothetical protein
MEPRHPPEYTLSLFADPTSVRDVVRAVLHTVFFHRYFPTLRPSTFEVLDLTLPYVTDPELESLIDTRVYQLVRQLSSTTSPSSGVRGQIGVQFFEKRRRKAGWFGAGGKGEEEVCWEVWRLEVTLSTPRTETGECCFVVDRGGWGVRSLSRASRAGLGPGTAGRGFGSSCADCRLRAERAKVIKAMETTLHKTALEIVAIVNQNKDHIPPITTSETNPFPYQIILNPRIEGWAKSVGMN